MNKSGFISNLRIYVSGADLWEKSYITDGWDPEATRKVENKQRYPLSLIHIFCLPILFLIPFAVCQKQMDYLI